MIQIYQVQEALYEFQNQGGHITTFNAIGHDPLGHRLDLMTEREEQFYQQYPWIDDIFHVTVNGDYSLLMCGTVCIIDISKQLVNSCNYIHSYAL